MPKDIPKDKPEAAVQPAEQPAALPVAKEAAPPVQQAAPKQEPEYTVEEFIQHPELFKLGADVVSAALGFAKVKSCTLAKARELVKTFAERKVI